MFAGRDYSPFHLYYRKSDGNECICPLGCYNSCEDIFIISFLLMGLWSFLLGCYALLLKSAIDTAESHTALWTFFWLGLIFVCMVHAGVYMDTHTDLRERVSVQRRSCQSWKRSRTRTRRPSGLP